MVCGRLFGDVGITSQSSAATKSLAPFQVRCQRRSEASFCTFATTATILRTSTDYSRDSEACLPTKTSQCRKPVSPPEKLLYPCSAGQQLPSAGSRPNVNCSTFQNSTLYYYDLAMIRQAIPGELHPDNKHRRNPDPNPTTQ